MVRWLLMKGRKLSGFFTVRDLSFIAIIGAAIYLLHRAFYFVAMATGLPFAGQIVHPIIATLPEAALLVICYGKVRKIGTYTLTALIWALLMCLSIPVAFPAFFIGGPFADITTWRFKRVGGGFGRACMTTAVTVYMALKSSIGAVILRLLLAKPVLIQLLFSWIFPAVVVSCTVLGLMGGLIGYKIVVELRKAGVMR